MDSAHGDSTSLSLLERAKAHDPLAWQRLVELYGPLVYHWCYSFGLRTGDVADVFQDVFLAVSSNLGRFRRDRPGDSFRGWLLTVVRSKALDHLRRQRGQPQGAGGDDALRQLQQTAAPPADCTTDGSDPGSSRSLTHRALDLLRHEFEEQTWRAFWETTVGGRCSTEVGAELGMSAGAVRKAKARVLRRLREEFGELLA